MFQGGSMHQDFIIGAPGIKSWAENLGVSSTTPFVGLMDGSF